MEKRDPRDPRLEPKAGDILIAPGNLRLHVTAVAKKLVMYKLVSLRPIHPIDSIPMACNHPLNMWRKIARNSEVLHAAD